MCDDLKINKFMSFCIKQFVNHILHYANILVEKLAVNVTANVWDVRKDIVISFIGADAAKRLPKFGIELKFSHNIVKSTDFFSQPSFFQIKQ